jgi:hypothetical protein
MSTVFGKETTQEEWCQVSGVSKGLNPAKDRPDT